MAKGRTIKDQTGRTPGASSYAFAKKSKAPDPRNKVSGGGGGVKRTASKPLAGATKKMVNASKKLNKAKGRKY